jgi:SSS family solute:Na+ symporter
MGAGFVQWVVFVALTSAIALLTWWRCRRETPSSDAAKEVFLAGGTLTWPFIAGSLLLTNISAEQIVGMNGTQAMLTAWWEIGAAVGLVILAHVLVPMYYRYRCTTTTELLEKRLGDAGIRTAVSLLFLLGYLVILLPVVLYTGAVFLKSMFQLEASILAIAAVYALAGLAYAAFGGLRAIAISDTYNGVMLLVMGGLVAVFAFRAIGFDLSGIPAERLTLVGGPESDIPWPTLFTGMVFIHLFYWGTNMVIAQRVLAAPTVREAQKGIYAAAAIKLLMPLVVVVPGVLAYKLYGDVGDVTYGRLVADVLPPWLAGAFAAMIFGAVLSSFNSCLNSAAALYAMDLHAKYVNPQADLKRIGQSVAVAFALGGLALVPLYQNAESIVATMQQMNGLYSMPVLAAFLVAVVGRRVAPVALRAGLAFGVALYAVFTFAWQPFGLHYIHLMAITLASTIALIYALGRALRAPSADSSGGQAEASSVSR